MWIHTDIFQNLENVQNMWCNKAGDDCIHFHTDHSYIFSHPPAKYWKETDPNVNRDHSVISKKQHLTQTISLRDDFYQDNFRKHWDVSQDLSNLIFLTRNINTLKDLGILFKILLILLYLLFFLFLPGKFQTSCHSLPPHTHIFNFIPALYNHKITISHIKLNFQGNN